MFLLALALSACAPTATTSFPPPLGPLEFEVNAWATAGQPVLFTVSGAYEGEQVYIVEGRPNAAPQCLAGLGGQCLGLGGRLSLFAAPVAEADGVATVTVPVPQTVTPGTQLTVQAVVVRGWLGVNSVLSEVRTVTSRAEDCTDMLDNDGNGLTDCVDPTCAPEPQCVDMDGDGVSLAEGDCDDNLATRYPGAPELCNNLDDDCDPEIDETVPGVLIAPPDRILSDTTWGPADGVVCLSSNVEVDHDVLLTVLPGTHVIGRNHELSVYGTLDASGAAMDPVVLRDLRVEPGCDASDYRIQLSHVRAEGGLVHGASGCSVDGTLQMTDSHLIGVGTTYVSRPTSPVLIARNVFENSSHIKALTSLAEIRVENNVFVGMTGMGAVVGGDYAGDGIIATRNSFLDVGSVAVHLPVGYSRAGVDAQENWWGTTDVAVIEAMIFDANDSAGVSGVVPYGPILTAPDPLTPSWP